MSDQFYLSPYRYAEGMTGEWTRYPVLDGNAVAEAVKDSTISRLDLAIMGILYHLHYASRRAIEAALHSYPGRKPKNLKRTLRTLILNGVVLGFALRGQNIRFYCLTRHSKSYMEVHGGQTDFPYERCSLRQMYKIMAYNQLAQALLPVLGNDRIVRHQRHYEILGIDGPVLADGYLELVHDDAVACIYIFVVRAGGGWLKEAQEWYRRIARYINGTPQDVILFLCEDGQQVMALGKHMTQLYPADMPRRYYTYDTLLFQGQLFQRIIVCDGKSMQYGTLSLSQNP